MLLLVTLHSVAITLYLFEWVSYRIRNQGKKKKFAFEFIDNLEMKKKVTFRSLKILILVKFICFNLTESIDYWRSCTGQW